MTERGKFASGIGWSYLQSWAARGITTFSFLIVGFYIGPKEFGLFAAVAAVLVFSELLCEQALSQTVVQLESVDQGSIFSIFILGLASSTLIAMALAFGANAAAEWFESPELAPLLMLASSCPIVIGLAAVPTGMLRRNMAFKVLAQRTVLASGISSALGIGLVIGGFGATGLIVQMVCYYVIGLVVLWRHCAWRPLWPIERAGIRGITKLYALNAVNRLSDFAETRGVELIVGALGGVSTLGIFAFANKIAQTAYQTVTAPVMEVVFAEVARQRGSTGVVNAVRNGQLIVATIPSALLFGLACVSGPLLAALYGDRWSAAATPVSILVAAFLLRGILYVFGSALLAIRALGAVVAIAVTRALVCTGLSYVALRHGMGPDGAAWSYLLAAMVVAPASSLVLSRKIGVPMKALVVIPAKLAASLGIAAMAFFAALWLMDGSAASPPFAVVSGIIGTATFLLVVITLNAGLLHRNLRQTQASGTMGKLLGALGRLAGSILKMRERARLYWFKAMLNLSINLHKRNKPSGKSALVVPADTAELDGSLGDQALLLGLWALSDGVNPGLVVSERFRSSSVFAGSTFVAAWNGLGAGWRLGKELPNVSKLYIIGADVMDGYYSPTASRQRLILVDAFARAGVPCGILGFSFNAAPHPDVVKEFRRIPTSVRICLRDAVSLERFERIVGRCGVLTADLAFLVHGVSDSAVSHKVSPWVEGQKRNNRRVLGLNVNPQVVAHLAHGSESAIADSVAAACKALTAHGISVVFVPHDFRPGCADLRIMRMVWERMGHDAQQHALLLSDPFSAQEIKSVCKGFDLVFSARMHLAIGALSVHTPVCGMQYQGKFAGLFQHFGFAANIFISPEDALDPQRLYWFLVQHMDNAGTLREQVVARLPAVRTLAELNALEPR